VKTPFDNLDRVLEHRVRLQIMSVLVTEDALDFNALKELLNVTDGNLASHIKALEKEKYINVSKTFIEKKPNTKYRITEKGKSSFRRHLDALEQVIRQTK
jgi:DNA-binding HxlR family transcriptional regulator